MELRELIDHIETFLDGIANTPEMDRTKREEQVLELGRAFVSSARAYQRAEASLSHVEEATTRVVKAGNAVADLAKSYIETNREYDLQGLDAEALAKFRKGRK